MLSSEADLLKRVVVCTPHTAYYDIQDLAAHNILAVADRRTAVGQHDRLKAVLESSGADVIDIPELAGHPNSVFTRDTALCTPEGYVQLLPGIETRRTEGRWMASALDDLGEPRVGQIHAPGSVDGGDVLLFGQVAFVGLSGRTNAAGYRQLSGCLGKMGYETRPVSLPDSVLHLDKVLMPVGPDKLLVCPDIVPRAVLRGFDRVDIPFNDRSTANIICLGNGRLIVADTNQGAMDALDRENCTIHRLEASEFVKGAGGPNCLILPVERTSA